MRKLMLLAAMMAMALVAAAPAFAQVNQTSGAATGGDVAIANSLGNQCVQLINQQNTGNVAQEQNVTQNLAQVNAIVANLVVNDVTGDVNAEQNVTGTNEAAQTASQEGIEQLVGAEQSCAQALAIAFFK